MKVLLPTPIWGATVTYTGSFNQVVKDLDCHHKAVKTSFKIFTSLRSTKIYKLGHCIVKGWGGGIRETVDSLKDLPKH